MKKVTKKKKSDFTFQSLPKLDIDLGPDEVEIGNYIFKRSCLACPEAYDVFNKHGDYIAYVRLRHGILRTDCFPKKDIAVEIYHQEFDDWRLGYFESNEDRDKYLKEISTKIFEYYKGLQ